jgi:parallel beta-helix repeat protein
MLLPTLCAFRLLAFYVAEGGRDTNNGSYQAPFATFERLQKGLRELPADHGAVVVHLKGTIRLASTLVLGPEANGVSFVGPATISGGTKIGGWRESTFNGHPAWVARAPFDFRQLFVGDVRAPRPHLPKTGFFNFAAYTTPQTSSAYNEGQTEMRFRPGDLRADWRNLSDVEVIAHHFWVTSRLPVAGIEGDVVRFGKKSVFRLRDDYSNGLAAYKVDNVAAAMDAPGEWYLDRPTHAVFYLPKPGEKLKNFAATAPRLETLVRVQGARQVRFADVQFRHTEPTLPADSAGDVQAAFSVPGAVQIADSEQVSLHNCQIREVGGYGVEILGASKGCGVEKSVLRDLGAGGIKIGNGPSGNRLSDNVIEAGGRMFPSACGILVQLSGGNRIVHNRIRDLYYTGISVGWDWGFRDTAAKDNLIADNDISDIGQDQLSDMGGIYVLGKQPGSVIAGNRIRRVSARGYGGWGVYLDEGSTGWTVENNVVLNTKTGGFHIHYGGNNVIRNNVFAYAQKEGQLIRSRDDQQGPIRFEHNLVVARPGDAPLVVPSWLKRDVVMTGNLYAVPKTTLPFGDDGTGRFVEVTLGADGLPAKGSPVYGLGFRSIDLRTVGPRR